MTVKVIGIDKTTGRCPHCGRKPVMMDLPVAADLSHTGAEYIKSQPIDACIAEMVSALNKGGIKTRTSCCGHGEVIGSINLMDRRELIIRTKRR